METTKRRTSFALDEATTERLRRLSRRWNVSQAEVVRRAVKLAADRADADGASVSERLQAYHRKNLIGREAADAFLSQVAEDRAEWGRDR